jgi:hypothetical protein
VLLYCFITRVRERDCHSQMLNINGGLPQYRSGPLLYFKVND